VLWGEWLAGWLAGGIRLDLSEWDLLADLDSGFHHDGEHRRAGATA
jgi:hypothetical protein